MGGHAGAEAVNSDALFLFRLVGTFHDSVIITNERGFVTEGYIYALFSSVEKMWIITSVNDQ